MTFVMLSKYISKENVMHHMGEKDSAEMHDQRLCIMYAPKDINSKET